MTRNLEKKELALAYDPRERERERERVLNGWKGMVLWP
jgi:hypothetical protein